VFASFLRPLSDSTNKDRKKEKGRALFQRVILEMTRLTPQVTVSRLSFLALIVVLILFYQECQYRKFKSINSFKLIKILSHVLCITFRKDNSTILYDLMNLYLYTTISQNYETHRSENI